jgi:hypothetical protein
LNVKFTSIPLPSFWTKEQNTYKYVRNEYLRIQTQFITQYLCDWIICNCCYEEKKKKKKIMMMMMKNGKLKKKKALWKGEKCAHSFKKN